MVLRVAIEYKDLLNAYPTLDMLRSELLRTQCWICCVELLRIQLCTWQNCTAKLHSKIAHGKIAHGKIAHGKIAFKAKLLAD